MTLREIAEDLPYISDQPVRGYLAYLLNAVVEEKAKFLNLHDDFRHPSRAKSDWDNDLNEICRNDWRAQALRELNLEGVWPRKEKL